MPAGDYPMTAGIGQVDGIQVQCDDRRAPGTRKSFDSRAAERPGEMPSPLLLARMKEFDTAPCQRIGGGGSVAFVLVTPRTAVTEIVLVISTATSSRDDVIDLLRSGKQKQR